MNTERFVNASERWTLNAKLWTVNAEHTVNGKWASGEQTEKCESRTFQELCILNFDNVGFNYKQAILTKYMYYVNSWNQRWHSKYISIFMKLKLSFYFILWTVFVLKDLCSRLVSCLFLILKWPWRNSHLKRNIFKLFVFYVFPKSLSLMGPHW